MRYPPFIENDFPFPPFHRVRLHFPHRALPDPVGELRRVLWPALAAAGVRAGDRVGIGVGSRGIRHLPSYVGEICRVLREQGARPVILPAMGSHGGATAEGQTAVLRRLGVSEASCGAPVVSSLAVRQVGTVFGEVPLYYSEDALALDHAIALNRIKPHSKFRGPAESGILKMLCVGLGKHEGALAFHRFAMKHGFFPLLREMGTALARAVNFRFGIAVVEDAYDEPARIEAVSAARLLEDETRLNALANELIPRLPFRTLDALVIGRIGKDISGAGMDPNVTGRAFDLMESDFSDILRATRVAVLRLSPATGGNAIGLGNADFITEAVFRAMDYEATVMNALTSLSLHKAFIPVRLPNDRKAIQACFTTLGPVPPEAVRAVILRDTLHLGEWWASAALAPELAALPQAEVLEAGPLPFDEAGSLLLD
ncbi:MAG: hypothetical protein WHT06_01260 [Desulfobacterales bacterium]